MKKFIYLFVAFSAVLVGCSKSEVEKAPGTNTPIAFKPYANRNLITKGTEATIEDLGVNGFKVYAFSNESAEADRKVAGYGDGKTHDPDKKAYMDKEVKSEDGIAWTYSGFIYWPATYYLDFVAYGLNPKVTETSPTTLKFTVDSDITTHEDLLVAAPQIDVKYGETTTDGTVNFVFSHLLSRISFLLETEGNTAGDSDNTLVTLEQVDLVGNFYTEGTVDLTKTKATSLNIGEPDENGAATAVSAERPYITGTTRPDGLVTYKLFGTDGHFSSYGITAGGDQVFDNGALYDFNEETDIIDQEYVRNSVDEEAVAETQADRYMMVIPVADWGTKNDGEETYTNAKLKVKYFLPGSGSSEVQTVELVKGTPATPILFEAGKSYVFKLKVSTWKIGISGTVEIWDETTGVTETFVLG